MRNRPDMVALLVIVAASACATPGADFEQLLEPDPSLPRPERVHVMGTLAAQRLVAAVPDLSSKVQQADLFTVTATLVDYMFKMPTEDLVASPEAFEITLYALAHQWGLCQLAVDHVDRYDRLFEARYEELKRQQRSLAWSNFFLGLSSMGYAMSNANATPTQQLSNELGMSRNQEAMQLNQLMNEQYRQQAGSLEELRIQITQIKQELVAYSNLLEIYRDWMMEAAAAKIAELSPEAQRILEAKASSL